MRRFAWGFSLVCLCASGVWAHGTIPTSNGVGVLDSGEVVLGTNFGIIYNVAASDLDFVCETAITGTQQAMDLWVLEADGRVGSAAFSGDFLRGIFRAQRDACVFGVVPQTELLLVSDFRADTQWVAVGNEPLEGECERSALYVGSSEAMERRVSRCRTTSASVATRGEDVLAVFSEPGRAFLYEASGALLHELPLESGVELRVLGISEQGLYYLVKRDENRDLLLVSDDRGQTLRELGQWPARLSAFASADGKVWVQSPQQGVLVGEEGQALRFVPGNGPRGACLYHHEGGLYACGNMVDDGYVLGRSDGAGRFEAVMSRYDHLTKARPCAASSSVQVMCQEELLFLRGYYGFEEVGPEPEPQPEPDSEPQPEVAEVVEQDIRASDEEGCHVGSLYPLWGLALTVVRRFGRTRRGILAHS